MLINLRQRVKTSNQQGCRNHTHPGYLQGKFWTGSVVYHKKYQCALAYDHGHKSNNGIFLQAYGPRTIGPGSNYIYQHGKYKVDADKKAGNNSEAIHEYGRIKQLTRRLERRFKSADTFFITIHVTVETITGWIDQTVNDEKNENGPSEVGSYYLAQRKPVHRHQEERKMKSQ